MRTGRTLKYNIDSCRNMNLWSKRNFGF
jgi:hypothetical protein